MISRSLPVADILIDEDGLQWINDYNYTIKGVTSAATEVTTGRGVPGGGGVLKGFVSIRSAHDVAFGSNDRRDIDLNIIDVPSENHILRI